MRGAGLQTEHMGHFKVPPGLLVAGVLIFLAPHKSYWAASLLPACLFAAGGQHMAGRAVTAVLCALIGQAPPAKPRGLGRLPVAADYLPSG